MSILTNPQALRNSTIELTPSSAEYPSAFLELSEPPTLYAFGRVALLQERMLAVVGSRKTPLNALKLGEEICRDVSEAFVIVTGVADGGDTAAIEGVLRGSGRLILLLAGGFSSLPQSNIRLLEKVVEKGGLLLSPHSFETEVRSYSYEYRNKLLAKLSEGVLVLGAGEKSGALITAKYAVRFQKPVFAFPYPPNSAAGVGCNRLIKQGGYLTECAEDIAKPLGIELVDKSKQVTLTGEEAAVYALLQGKIEGHINEIAAQAGVPSFKLRAILSALEIKGLIVATGGNKFSIV